MSTGTYTCTACVERTRHEVDVGQVRKLLYYTSNPEETHSLDQENA